MKLVADKLLKTNQWKHKYASLGELLDVAVPALAKHNVLLVQEIGTADGEVTVRTKVLMEGAIEGARGDYPERTSLQSPVLSIRTDGTTRDIAAKITSGCRLQLMAFLALPAQEEDDVERNLQGKVQPVSQLPALIQKLRYSDNISGPDMATVPVEGKKVSMYDYLISRVHPVTLSYLLDREITRETPPRAGVEWFVKDVMAGKYEAELAEAYQLATR